MLKEIRRTQNYLGRKYFLRYLLNSYNRIDEVYAARIGKNLYQCLCESGCYDLCIDEKELRYGFKDRYSSVEKLISKIPNKGDISITLATKGSLFKKKGKKLVRTPIFFDNVKDTLGSGDAYFSITSALNFLNINENITSFLGNVYAGLSTQFIANSDSTEISKLRKSVESIYNISD